MQREKMEFDVVIVGAGPAGLATACKLMQCAEEQQQEISVCVVEKGAEVGAHLISGAIFETTALDELFPDWKHKDAPVSTQITMDDVFVLRDSHQSFSVPPLFVPKSLHNKENYLISIGEFCVWLAKQAENMGVEIFTGFSAEKVLIEDQKVFGVVLGDMGIGADGKPKDNFMAGMELRAKCTVFSEGCRGHLGKQLIQELKLSQNKSPQHYAIGFKEIWKVSSEDYKAGKVIHTAGWPLNKKAHGGGFLYQGSEQLVTVGLVVDLNYKNPFVNPFQEFQSFKTHPLIAEKLRGGERISYGARALTKGGLHSLPSLDFDGGVIIGCDAGTLNSSKLKGTHTAMKSGMLAAEAIMKEMKEESSICKPKLNREFKQSWLYDELNRSKNFASAIYRFGLWGGGLFNFIDQNIFQGKLPLNLKNDCNDHLQLLPAKLSQKIDYKKPDGKLTFDRLSSVYLSNIYHDENQPCHLKLKDSERAVQFNIEKFFEPAQRYCPASVYEVIEEEGQKKLQINAQNCIHCKTCDIKDPLQNIEWSTPEGGSGPNYMNM